MSNKQLYCAGPMSGYAEFNFPAFFAAQKKYEDLGYKVWNPAAKDMEDAVHKDKSFETGDDKTLMESGWSFEEAFLWDVTKVCQSRTIVMLPGWEFSHGAVAEHAVAVSMKKRYPDYEIIYE